MREGKVYSVVTDRLGRPEVAWDSNKAVVWRAANRAFDRTEAQDSIGGLHIGFPGQYDDKETGFWYNGHRDYDPSTDRYLQPDPIGLGGGMNTYVYALANPTMYIDFLGLEWEYSQSKGTISHDGQKVGMGYSGVGQGLNNPEMQSVKNIGPIPIGEYLIGPGHPSGKGPITMNLIPSPKTNTFGRYLFRIHGDNRSLNHSASEGCIITGPDTRSLINGSGDHILRVEP